MDKEKVISYLKENNLSDIEEIPYKNESIVLRFFYDFDEDELKAAKAYANDECEEEKEGEEWFQEFFLPYLNDVAIDNVGEILEETMEELNVDIQYISYELDEENHDYNEFIAVIFEKGKDLDIEEVLEELNI